MSCRSTLQADALKLVARKLQSSLAVEGELPEDGLAAYEDEGDDLMMALARKIVSSEEETESVEAVFAAEWDAEATAEELLVVENWRPVEVEPQSMGVNGDRTSGRHDGIGIGPTVELVPESGHAPAPVNGNGHHQKASESQRSLFSWAKFMTAEPMKAKRRKSKTQPATASLFEWALEQEREKEPVGAAR